jgi:hypothetical protein
MDQTVTEPLYGARIILDHIIVMLQAPASRGNMHIGQILRHCYMKGITSIEDPRIPYARGALSFVACEEKSGSYAWKMNATSYVLIGSYAHGIVMKSC